jgi:hypothetical protein
MKYLSIIFISIYSFIGFCQKPFVSLTCDQKTAQVGDQVIFTVKSNIEGNVEIDFSDQFIQGYGSMNGMEQEMDYNSGTVSTIYYFSQNGAFKENGNFSFYAYVKNRKAIYKSNKVSVKIESGGQQSDEDVSRKNLKEPVFGIIQKSKSKIYEGEPLILEAKVYSKLNINMLEAYQAFELEGSTETKELEKASNLILRKENFKGTQMLTFTYGKQLVFPNGTGKYRIKPFEMALQYHEGGIFSERMGFTSNSSSIEVLPLPAGAPKSFIGAVGKFDVDFTLNKELVKQGDVAVLTIYVTGAGNLHNITKPVFNLPKGLIIYGDPEIEENIDYGIRGAEGKVAFKYNLLAKGSGKIEMPAISIAYFDPELKKYVIKKKEGSELEVVPSKDFQKGATIVRIEEKNSAEEKFDFIENSASKNDYNSGQWFWPSLFSPLFLAFVGGIFIARRKNQSSSIKEKISRKKAFQKIEEDLAASSSNYATGKEKEAYSNLESIICSFSNLFQSVEDLPSKSNLYETLKSNSVEDSLIESIKAKLLICEEIRYAFDLEKFDFRKDVEELQSILKKLS